MPCEAFTLFFFPYMFSCTHSLLQKWDVYVPFLLFLMENEPINLYALIISLDDLGSLASINSHTLMTVCCWTIRVDFGDICF